MSGKILSLEVGILQVAKSDAIIVIIKRILGCVSSRAYVTFLELLEVKFLLCRKMLSELCLFMIRVLGFGTLFAATFVSERNRLLTGSRYSHSRGFLPAGIEKSH